MTDLETKLRALADNGNFSHLSIISNGKSYHASFSPASTWGRGMADSADPVHAAIMAIETAPKGPKVHPPAAHTKSTRPLSTRPRAEDGASEPQANEPAPKSLMELWK
jgi:hypothetical protein